MNTAEEILITEKTFDKIMKKGKELYYSISYDDEIDLFIQWFKDNSALIYNINKFTVKSYKRGDL